MKSELEGNEIQMRKQQLLKELEDECSRQVDEWKL